MNEISSSRLLFIVCSIVGLAFVFQMMRTTNVAPAPSPPVAVATAVANATEPTVVATPAIRVYTSPNGETIRVDPSLPAVDVKSEIVEAHPTPFGKGNGEPVPNSTPAPISPNQPPVTIKEDAQPQR